MITEIKFKKLRENAKIPQRATVGSAGLDLCACIDEPITLDKGGHALIPTGLAIALEDAGNGFHNTADKVTDGVLRCQTGKAAPGIGIIFGHGIKPPLMLFYG